MTCGNGDFTSRGKSFDTLECKTCLKVTFSVLSSAWCEEEFLRFSPSIGVFLPLRMGLIAPGFPPLAFCIWRSVGFAAGVVRAACKGAVSRGGGFAKRCAPAGRLEYTSSSCPGRVCATRATVARTEATSRNSTPPKSRKCLGGCFVASPASDGAHVFERAVRPSWILCGSRERLPDEVNHLRGFIPQRRATCRRESARYAGRLAPGTH